MAFEPRTIQEVIDEMVLDKESRSELDVLTNPSNASIWYNMLGLFAAEVVILEELMAEVETDLEARKQELPTGTLKWYAAETLVFQFGDSLEIINGIPQYSVIDTDKQIIEVSSATEQSGFVVIKAAKFDVSDDPEPLDTPELDALTQYWIEKRFAGTAIQIISQDGDLMQVDARIEVDGQKIDSIGESTTDPGVFPVEEAIKDYWKALPFDGKYTIMNMVDAIQAADGVLNVVVNEVLAKAFDAISYTDVTALSDQSYTAIAGYIVEDPADILRDTLIYVL